MQSTKPQNILQTLHLIRAALAGGLLTKEEVVDWADEIITKDEQPDIFFIDLALSSSKSTNDVIHYFNDYLNFETPVIKGQPLLGFLYKQFINKQLTLEQTVERLYRLKFEAVFTEKEEGYIYTIEDRFDCAKHNIHGTLEKVSAEVEKFLAFYKDYSLESYEQWRDLDLIIEPKPNKDKSLKQKEKGIAPFVNLKEKKPWWKIWHK